jgi:glutamyl-tRNA synthetase
MKAEDRENLARFLARLKPVVEPSDFSKTDLESKVRAEATALGIKLPPLAQALRYAVTGGRHSPGLFDMLELQGKERVLRRVGSALHALSSGK